MRISDWSSDVCSSDLGDGGQGHVAPGFGRRRRGRPVRRRRPGVGPGDDGAARSHDGDATQELRAELVGQRAGDVDAQVVEHGAGLLVRSEERRVGDGWVRTWRSRWWSYNKKKK